MADDNIGVVDGGEHLPLPVHLQGILPVFLVQLHRSREVSTGPLLALFPQQPLHFHVPGGQVGHRQERGAAVDWGIRLHVLVLVPVQMDADQVEGVAQLPGGRIGGVVGKGKLPIVVDHQTGRRGALGVGVAARKGAGGINTRQEL